MTRLGFDHLAEALRDAGSVGEAAELHGRLCGALSLMGEQAIQPWVSESLNDAPANAEQRATPQQLLKNLAEATGKALDAGDMSLQLLLPDDESSLPQRAEALSEWCQGFIHGLGVAGADSEVLRAGVVAEVMADFVEITKVDVDDSGSAEEAETAYAELVEYVRVSVQLVYEELRSVRRDAPSGGRLH